MALQTLKDKSNGTMEPPDDGADHLRADILGSIVGSDPRLPNYLGRINNLITAHGAVGNKTFAPGSRDYDLSVSATNQPAMKSPRAAMDTTAPDLGTTTPGGPLETTPPVMGPAKPQRSLLGKIGHVAARMGNIAGDILAPGITALIPGSDLNKAVRASGVESRREEKEKESLEERRVGTEERKVGVEEAKEKREAETAGQPKPKEESWEISKDYTGPNGEPVEVEKNSGALRLAGSGITGIKRVEKPGTAEQDTQRATQLRADLVAGKKLSPEDAAWLKGHTEEKTVGPYASAAAQAPEKGSERLDRSYQFNSGQLTKDRQPIDQKAARLSDLVSNINFQTPQADALIAPEILSIAAGGAGSGLRMNEAEISRVIGGATNWTKLQTALNKWSTDPAHATFTADQRKQMRQIIQAAQGKLTAKKTILEQGEQDLSDADDVKTHRQVVANTRKLLDAVDAGKKIVRKDGKIQIGE